MDQIGEVKLQRTQHHLIGEGQSDEAYVGESSSVSVLKNVSLAQLNQSNATLQHSLANITEHPEKVASPIANHSESSELVLHELQTVVQNNPIPEGVSIYAAEEEDNKVQARNDDEPTPPSPNNRNLNQEFIDSYLKYLQDKKLNYIDPYGRVITLNTELIGKLGDLQTLLGSLIKAGPDNTTDLDIAKLKEEIEAITMTYRDNPDNALFTITAATEKEASAAVAEWAKRFGLDANPGYKVRKNADGTVTAYLTLDFGPLNRVWHSLNERNGNGRFSQAEYAAWSAGLDAQKATMETTLKKRAEEFGRSQNNFFEDANRFSTMLQAIYEACAALLPRT